MSRPDGDSQHFRDLTHVPSYEEPEFHELGSCRVEFGEAIEEFIYSEQFIRWTPGGNYRFRQLLSLCLSAPLRSFSSPCLIHQNPSHGLACGGKKVPAAVPVPGFVRIDQPDVSVMHKRCGLQCLTRLLLSHSSRRQLPQLVVHKRQQLLGRRRITGFDLRKNLSDISHGQRLRDKQDYCSTY